MISSQQLRGQKGRRQCLMAGLSLALLVSAAVLDKVSEPFLGPLFWILLVLAILIVKRQQIPLLSLVFASCLSDALRGLPWGASAGLNLLLVLFLIPWKEGLSQHGPVRAVVLFVLLHALGTSLYVSLLSLIGGHVVICSFSLTKRGLALLEDLFIGGYMWHSQALRRKG